MYQKNGLRVWYHKHAFIIFHKNSLWYTFIIFFNKKNHCDMHSSYFIKTFYLHDYGLISGLLILKSMCLVVCIQIVLGQPLSLSPTYILQNTWLDLILLLKHMNTLDPQGHVRYWLHFASSQLYFLFFFIFQILLQIWLYFETKVGGNVYWIILLEFYQTF